MGFFRQAYPGVTERHARPVPVVPGIVAANDVAVELGPFDEVIFPFPLFPHREGVAGGTDGDDRLAPGGEIDQQLHLGLGQEAAPNTDQDNVGFLDGLDARQVVALFFAGVDVVHLEEMAEMFRGEGGQGLVGLVFALGHDDQQVGALVVLEAKGASAEKAVAGDRRADELLDMLHDEVGAGEVADEGRHGRVVHRVGHVAHEDDVLAVAGHLAQAEGASEDAHIGVDSQEDDVLDLPVLQDAPDLGAVVADVVAVVDVDLVGL